MIAVVVVIFRIRIRKTKVAVEKDPDQYQNLIQTVKERRESTRNITKNHPPKNIKSIVKSIVSQDMKMKKM
jgi:hypothetical protein